MRFPRPALRGSNGTPVPSNETIGGDDEESPVRPRGALASRAIAPAVRALRRRPAAR
jgi:hypothetical protein